MFTNGQVMIVPPKRKAETKRDPLSDIILRGGGGWIRREELEKPAEEEEEANNSNPRLSSLSAAL